MIFYMEQDKEPGDEFCWIPCFIISLQARHFKNYKFQINGIVYTVFTEEFEEALEKDRMWDNLIYREPDVD